jgi:hypothetical protein
MSTTTPSTLPPNLMTPDPEVNDRYRYRYRSRRRRFSAADKLRILEEIDRAASSEIGPS